MEKINTDGFSARLWSHKHPRCSMRRDHSILTYYKTSFLYAYDNKLSSIELNAWSAENESTMGEKWKV
ncbi:hypothetical protein NQZ68_030994 [Dissostichus eleginoides]|nr:hypothetical protein NQZ68_030994 [Dissostichus eleginoides]